MNDNLIAVYGSLLSDKYNHKVIADGEFLGEFITEPVFNMYSFGQFPGVVLGGTTAIHTEIYRVSEKTLKRVYRLEGFLSRDNPDNWIYNSMDVETPWGTAELFYLTEIPKRARLLKDGKW